MIKNVQQLRSRTLKHPRLVLYSFLLGTAFSSGLIAQDKGDLVKVEQAEQVEQEDALGKTEQEEQPVVRISEEEVRELQEEFLNREFKREQFKREKILEARKSEKKYKHRLVQYQINRPLYVGFSDCLFYRTIILPVGEKIRDIVNPSALCVVNKVNDYILSIKARKGFVSSSVVVIGESGFVYTFYVYPDPTHHDDDIRVTQIVLPDQEAQNFPVTHKCKDKEISDTTVQEVKPLS